MDVRLAVENHIYLLLMQM